MADRITTMNISLPASMRTFVRKRMSDAGFANASEYIRHLIRAEQSQVEKVRLQEFLQEGLDSGPPTPMTRAYWETIRRRIRARVRSGRRKSA